MKNLYIIGAGGFGREVLSMAKLIHKTKQTEWRIKGFLDDNLNALDGIDTGNIKVVDTISDHKVSKENVYVCAIADSETRQKICDRLKKENAEFIPIIHPSCSIGEFNKIGEGLIMCQNSLITENVTIGDFVIINAFTGIGHDALIGDYSTISAHCDITGHTVLGKKVFLGSSAVISPGIIVEDNARVGTGSIVVKKVKANTTVFGNPAKRIF